MNHEIVKCKYFEKKKSFWHYWKRRSLSSSFKISLKSKHSCKMSEVQQNSIFLREPFCQKQLLVVRFWFGAIYQFFNESDLLQGLGQLGSRFWFQSHPSNMVKRGEILQFLFLGLCANHFLNPWFKGAARPWDSLGAWLQTNSARRLESVCSNKKQQKS